MNRERAGERDPRMALLSGGDNGFVFDAGCYRDALFLGNCDDGVRESAPAPPSSPPPAGATLMRIVATKFRVDGSALCERFVLFVLFVSAAGSSARTGRQSMPAAAARAAG